MSRGVAAVAATGLLASGGATEAQAAPPPAIAYPGFTSAAGLLLGGTAMVTGGALRLTDGGRDEAGSAWSTTTVDPRAPFETTFEVSMTGRSPHADGVAFVVQTDGPRAIGGHGGSIGYGGMTHSVAVELDTYRNRTDVDGNHVAVVSAGHSDLPQPGAAPAPVPLFGRPVEVRIVSAPRAGTFTVSLRDGYAWRQVLRQRVDLAAVLGSGPAYVGFTGATGTSVSTQRILRWRLVA